MTLNVVLQLLLNLIVLLVLVKPLGAYMARVYSNDRTFLDPLVRPVERFISRQHT